MRYDEQLSSLISDIYDAALDPEAWSGALVKICEFVGGSAAGLHARDTASGTGQIFYEIGTDPRYGQLYFEKYIKLDPMGTACLTVDVGEVFSNSMLVPPSEFIETRFYQEWVKPQGWIDNILVVLERSGTSQAEHLVVRHERDGIADEAARQRMRLIVPHLRRAVLIGKVLNFRTAEAATFADVLDGISAGVLLIDAHGRILHANASGQSLLLEGSVLRATGGKLAANDAEAEGALHDLFLAAGSGDATVDTRSIGVTLASREGERHVAHVLPLTSGARRQTGRNYAAAASLFVRRAALDIPSPPEVIAKTFKLTPSELRVLLGIVEVGGLRETAEALGISAGTAKTHLLRVFGKTGTRRQAELVKLVAGFANPLAG
jgi:DNA-binding CsgD family transcriptional regulator